MGIEKKEVSVEELNEVVGGINLQDLSVDEFLKQHPELLAITKKQDLAQELLKINVPEMLKLALINRLG